jgi:hypothetical protein
MHPDRLSATEVLGEILAPPRVQGFASHFRNNQYAQLKRLIKMNGLLDRQPAYHAGKMAFTLGLLAVSLALLFVLGDTWFHLPRPLEERLAHARVPLPKCISPLPRSTLPKRCVSAHHYAAF